MNEAGLPSCPQRSASWSSSSRTRVSAECASRFGEAGRSRWLDAFVRLCWGGAGETVWLDRDARPSGRPTPTLVDWDKGGSRENSSGRGGGWILAMLRLRMGFAVVFAVVQALLVLASAAPAADVGPARL